MLLIRLRCKKIIKTIPIFVAILIALQLSGCASDSFHYQNGSSQSTSNNAQVSALPKSGYYRVKKGDTLFAIAFRYGIDYRKLAQANRIPSPYVIYPQQKIRLNVSSSSSVVASTASNSKAKIAIASPKKQADGAKNSIKKKVNGSTKNTKSSPIPTKNTLKWQWPIKGFVVRGFSNAGVSSKGIDIKSDIGKPVQAAEDGIVVYSGNGLIGYGNLVIVKHNDEYLSAYAYNRSILVKEQQVVKAGDSLAIIGGKGEERPLLHFEIRRDGQPIDPLTVLPKP
ncbi:peptidoglycan DD-metalloendopeptidase family protein [Marinomonas algicola]|uniref:peptidoglycan DD-metalloendopeptidase family protein n=1 Tax=Marinomonas algicola TaxID=2773454 RepID=UPI001EFEF47B|nr:peptidoglycan DD-metalloendopeptidase family protein [Marinomonas algicola]